MIPDISTLMAEVVLLLNSSTPTPVILLNKLLSQGEGVPFGLLQPTLTDLVKKEENQGRSEERLVGAPRRGRRSVPHRVRTPPWSAQRSSLGQDPAVVGAALLTGSGPRRGRRSAPHWVRTPPWSAQRSSLGQKPGRWGVFSGWLLDLG
ncbi:unnamed protein product [Boreogadus saida]